MKIRCKSGSSKFFVESCQKFLLFKVSREAQKKKDDEDEAQMRKEMKETWAKNWEESRQGRFGQKRIRKWKFRDCTNFPYNYCRI